MGHAVDTSCTILDFEGVGIRAITQAYGYLQEASKLGQNNFPERIGTTLMTQYLDAVRQVLPYQCTVGICDCLERGKTLAGSRHGRQDCDPRVGLSVNFTTTSSSRESATSIWWTV